MEWPVVKFLDCIDACDGGGAGVTDHALLTNVTTSQHHVRYDDAEAVTAMGVEDDANSLNHSRYTDAEAIAAVGPHFSGDAVDLGSGVEVAGRMLEADGAGGTQFTDPPAGGSSLWPVDLTDPMTSLTGWTTGNGSWSINTYLECVRTATAQNRARFDTAVLNTLQSAVQVEVEIPSGLINVNQHIRVGILQDSAVLTSGGIFTASFGVRGDGVAYFERDGSLPYPVGAYTIPAVGTWITVTMVNIGNRHIGFIDGVKYGEYWANFEIGAEGFHPYVVNYASSAMTVRYRNLKTWSADLDLGSILA